MTRSRRFISAFSVSVLLWVVSGQTAAAQNVVRLTPDPVGADAGTWAELDLEIDFSDPSFGGGIVIEFDPAHLAFDSFSFDAAAPDDPALRLVCPSIDPACSGFSGPGILVAFASDTVTVPAIVGAHTIGRLRLDVLVTTSSDLILREDDSVAGPLIGVGAFTPPILDGATVTPGGVSPPVPAFPQGGIGVLLLLAFLALSGMVRAATPKAERG